MAIGLGLSFVVAACGGEPTATLSDAGRTPDPLPSATAPGVGPGATPRGPASLAPATPEPDTPEPEPTADPSPTERPAASADPEPTERPAAGAGGCTGTDENQAFYEAVAAAVDWSVYCPSLPRGWFVRSGQYRLSDGGRLEIAYRGPDGSGLMLQEGGFCSAGDCVPPGEELGDAAFADRTGTLVRTADGFAVSVDRGERASWLLLVSGQPEDVVRTIAADLVRVGD